MTTASAEAGNGDVEAAAPVKTAGPDEVGLATPVGDGALGAAGPGCV
jgi:hypothetical protein